MITLVIKDIFYVIQHSALLNSETLQRWCYIIYLFKISVSHPGHFRYKDILVGIKDIRSTFLLTEQCHVCYFFTNYSWNKRGSISCPYYLFLPLKADSSSKRVRNNIVFLNFDLKVMTYFSDVKATSQGDTKDGAYASIDTIDRNSPYMDLAQRSP